MDLFDLSGRTAIITGGNGGLGLSMARGLAKAGANIAKWTWGDITGHALAQKVVYKRVLVTQCQVRNQHPSSRVSHDARAITTGHRIRVFCNLPKGRCMISRNSEPAHPEVFQPNIAKLREAT